MFFECLGAFCEKHFKQDPQKASAVALTMVSVMSMSGKSFWRVLLAWALPSATIFSWYKRRSHNVKTRICAREKCYCTLKIFLNFSSCDIALLVTFISIVTNFSAPLAETQVHCSLDISRSGTARFRIQHSQVLDPKKFSKHFQRGQQSENCNWK